MVFLVQAIMVSCWFKDSRRGALTLFCLLALMAVHHILILGVGDAYKVDTVDLKAKVTSMSSHISNLTLRRRQRAPPRPSLTFYMIDMPEITDWLLGNFTEAAYEYYERALSEEQAEIWIHRGLQHHAARTYNSGKADVVIICGYLHLNHHLLKLLGASKESTSINNVPYSPPDWVELLRQRLVPTKTHILAVPTWNPTRGREIRLEQLKRMLQMTSMYDDYLSLGFERNTFWQKLPPDRILPVPYVVVPTLERATLRAAVTTTTPSNPNKDSNNSTRIRDSVFYAGDERPHAVAWAGCNRTQLLAPLIKTSQTYNSTTTTTAAAATKTTNQTSTATSSTPSLLTLDVQLVDEAHRLDRDDYTTRLLTADYCLIVCGDTPTSRSLASAMLHGCLPLRIGSRWRGLCERPCTPGWGWTVATTAEDQLSHLPFDRHGEGSGVSGLDWSIFPEVDEALWLEDPVGVLEDVVSSVTSVRKKEMRSVLKQHQMAWVYGWGNPVNSSDFGNAVISIWDSMEAFLRDRMLR